jgi:hypothetical protein
MMCLLFSLFIFVSQAVAAPGSSAGDHLIEFQASMSERTSLSGMTVEVVRLGETKRIILKDDGRTPKDVAYDGIWVGSDVGAYSRTITVRLYGQQPTGEQVLLYSGVERTDSDDSATIGWRVNNVHDQYTAFRSPTSYPGNVSEIHVGLPLIAGFGWGLFVLCYVGLLIRATRREPSL